MRTGYYGVKLFEVLVTVFSTYLAIRSFLASAWLERACIVLSRESVRVKYISPVLLSTLFNFLLIGFIFLITTYSLYSGIELNFSSLYKINFLLLLPGLLSYSKIDLLRLSDRTFIWSLSQGFSEILFSGFVVSTGYITLRSISYHMILIDDLTSRGFNEDEIELVYTNQVISTVGLVLASVVSVGLISLLVPFIENVVHGLVANYSGRFLILGILSISSIALSLVLYVRKNQLIVQEEKG